MPSRQILALLGSWIVLCIGPAFPLLGQDESAPRNELKIVFADADRETATGLQPVLKAGRDRIETYFGAPFSQPFEVEIHSDRAAFDAYFARRWNSPKTEAWMVASGVADRLTVLSPRRCP